MKIIKIFGVLIAIVFIFNSCSNNKMNEPTQLGKQVFGILKNLDAKGEKQYNEGFPTIEEMREIESDMKLVKDENIDKKGFSISEKVWIEKLSKDYNEIKEKGASLGINWQEIKYYDSIYEKIKEKDDLKSTKGDLSFKFNDEIFKIKFYAIWDGKEYRLVSIRKLKLSRNFSDFATKGQDNMRNFTKNMTNDPRFSSEIQQFQKLASIMHQKDFDYTKYIESRNIYLDKIDKLAKSDKNDSFKLAVFTSILANKSLVNSSEKKKLFSQIDTELFSKELMDDYRKSLGTPKYQIGDKLDVESLYSYEKKDEIPLTLSSEVNIIFFWSSWCANCKRYYSPIDNLIEKYNDSQLNIVGISLDQKKSNMKNYEKKHDFQFTSHSDLNKKWKSENAKKFGVIGIPVCLVVDRNKNILLVNPPAIFLENMIDAIIE